ncbi:DUF4328 domain-containing protein [Kitasatospora sp. RG8]|uniref:DUF4328 domain-containing protein n=1 Tax=Kitasatospora sp. RG8 TaxID=2820815 RepID=UPI001AE0410E|nr:DUF4328 domain-containing protein [Kitasatospora sp. RG8]MBP0455139.1 DUF4328 domain-containing protein [Kitasatospora sp. RG8]
MACGARPVGTDSGRCFGCAEAAPGWAAALRPANGLAAAVYVLLGLNAVLAAAVVAVDVRCDLLLGRLLDGSGDAGLDDFDAVDSVAEALNGVFLPLALATAVMFIVWFHRIRENADLLLPNGHRHGRGWTIGAWFTPIVLLWFPWQLMVDCWRASAPLDAEGRRRAPSEKVLALWWSTWIGSIVLGRIAAASMHRVDLAVLDSLDDLRNTIRVEVAGSALRLVAAVAAILVVNRLTFMQQARRAEVNPLAARVAQEARVQTLASPPTAATAPAATPASAATSASADAPHATAPEAGPPA